MRSISIFLLIAVLLSLLAVSFARANDLTELLTGENKEEVTTKAISPESSPRDDRKILKRIQGIFSELDDLKEVKVQVRKGVVTLTGELDSTDIEKRAVQYARNVEGVVEVENSLTITRDIERRVNTTLEQLQKSAGSVISNLPLILLALLMVVVFWFLAGQVAALKFIYRGLTPNDFIASLLSQIVRVIIILIGIILALNLLDATSLIGTVMGAAGIVGLAIGFAIRDTVENYIASILLSLRNPFEPNDWVTIEGHEGSVIRLTSRATILMTADGNHVRIPNATVFKGVITNYSRNPMRRFSFKVGVEMSQDLLKVQEKAMEVVAGIEGVLSDPQPMTTINELGGSCVVVTIYGWVDQKKYSFARVRSETIRLVKEAYEEAGIEMPSPSYNLQISNVDRLPEAGVEQTPPETDRMPSEHSSETLDMKANDQLEEQIDHDREYGDAENLLTRKAAREL